MSFGDSTGILPAGSSIVGSVLNIAGTLTDLEILVLAQPNPLNAAFVVGEKTSGRVAFGIGNDARIIGITTLPVGTSVVGADMGLPGNLNLKTGVLRDLEVLDLSPFNHLGLQDAIIDSNYRVASGTTPAGQVITYAPSTAIVVPSAAPLSQTFNPFAPNADTLSFHSLPDGSAVQQVNALVEQSTSTFDSSTGHNNATVTGAKAVVALTSGSVNHCTQPAANQDDSWISYVSTPVAGGSPSIMKMNRWGKNKLAAVAEYLKIFALNHVLISGQSNSTGTVPVITGPGQAVAMALSTVQPFENVMFNAGVRPGGNILESGFNVMPTPTSLVPLVEQVNTSPPEPNDPLGETFASCFANTVYQWMLNDGVPVPFLMSCWGVGGQVMANLVRGTQAYTNGQAQVTAGKALAAAAGYPSYGVSAILFDHGEADVSNTSYDPGPLQAQFEPDTIAITGQATNIPMFLSQVSTATTGTQTLDLAKYLQLQASINNPGNLVLIGPSYMASFAGTPSHADQHRSSFGHRLMGGYHAKAYYRRVIQNLPWRPLTPRKIVREGANIYIDFWVPVPPIKFDFKTVLPPVVPGGLFGFEYADSNGTLIPIVSVTITGPTRLVVTLASVPTASNKWMRYAYTSPSVPGYGGPTLGQRGNLCDSDLTTSFYGELLPNWCTHFSYAIN